MPTPRKYYPRSGGERNRRFLAAWRAKFGDWCPGWRTEGHYATAENPLTVDHIVPRSKGGSSRWSNLRGLCSECNDRRQARPDWEPSPPGTRHPLL